MPQSLPIQSVQPEQRVQNGKPESGNRLGVEQGMVLCKIDIKDAYFYIPCATRLSTAYLRFFLVDGVCYQQFQVLPFGINSAPRIYTKRIFKTVLVEHLLRKGNHTIAFYLRQHSCPSKDKGEEMLRSISHLTKQTLLNSRGFHTSNKEIHIFSNITVQFLGFILNLKEMKVFILERKNTRKSQRERETK